MYQLLFILLVLLVVILAMTVIYLVVNPSKKQATSQSQPAPAPKIDVDDHVLVNEARSKAKEIILEARDNASKIKGDAEEYVCVTKQSVVELEKTFALEKAQLDAKDRDLENKAKTLKLAKDALDKKQQDLDSLFDSQKQQLEKVANLTKDEARKLLLDKLDKELIEEKGKRIRQIEEDIKKTADKKAQEILVDVMRF